MNGTPSDWTCIEGRGFRVNGTTEDALQQFGSLDRAEPAESCPSNQSHPLHVGDEVDGLRDRGELVGADRQQQEDRAVGIAADHVAEHAERVVVGPLDVVDEECERADRGDLADRDTREIERAEEFGVR
jgi:hypothetical protein